MSRPRGISFATTSFPRTVISTTRKNVVLCKAPTNSTTNATVTYRGKQIAALPNEKLRSVLLRNGTHPHNGGLLITCKGLGTCGTCAVAVTSGRVHPPTRSWRETARFSFPPHTAENTERKSLRLSCQVRVIEDVSVEKFAGFWGHKASKLDPFESKDA